MTKEKVSCNKGTSYKEKSNILIDSAVSELFPEIAKAPCKGSFRESSPFIKAFRKEILQHIKHIGYDVLSSEDNLYYYIHSKDSIFVKTLGFKLTNFNRAFLPSLGSERKVFYKSISGVDKKNEFLEIEVYIKNLTEDEWPLFTEYLSSCKDVVLPYRNLPKKYINRNTGEISYRGPFTVLIDNKNLYKSVFNLVKDFI